MNKKESDGVLYDQKFDINHIIDEKLKDPNLKLKFGNNEFSLAEINNLIPSKEKKIDMFIEWDNMCQYSIFGIVSVINSLIKEDRKFNFHDFVRRDKYPNSIDYVKKIIYPDIKPELIDKTIKKYYAEIMSKSPVTSFFTKLNLMKFMLNSVTFMFRYEVDGLDKLISEISEDKFNNEVTCKYSVYPSEEYEIEAIKKLPLKELYVVPDMGLYYQTMMENDKEYSTILSYRDHNGMNPIILAYYFEEFINNGLDGPNNISLDFLREYNPTEEDIKKEEQKNDRC